jgi:hypothetical protein
LAEFLAELREQARAEQRIAAELEEIVIDPHPAGAEHTRPDVAQKPLGVGRGLRTRPPVRRCPPPGCGRSARSTFPKASAGSDREHHESGGDHVVGKARS